MKIIITLFICICSLTLRAAPPAKAKPNIAVTNETHEKWEVKGNGVITIENDDVGKTEISEQFITENTDWTPSKIECVWSEGFVAIFARHPRVTEIIVFDLKKNKKIKQKFLKNAPEWFEDAQMVKEGPAGEWEENTLKIESSGFLKTGEPKKSFQILQVKNGEFTIQPIDEPNNEPADEPKEETKDPNKIRRANLLTQSSLVLRKIPRRLLRGGFPD